MDKPKNNNAVPKVDVQGSAIEKPERGRLEDINRRQNIVRFLSAAAVGDKTLEKMLKDPDLTDWLVGLVERQDDGTERYVTPAIERAINKNRLQGVDIEGRLREARRRAGAPVVGFLERVDTSRQTLRDARSTEEKNGGSVLRDPAIVMIDARISTSYDHDFMSGRMTAFTNVGRKVIASVSGKVKKSTLLRQMTGDLESYIIGDGSTTQKLNDLLSKDDEMDAATRDAVLKILKEAVPVKFLTQDKRNAAKNLINEHLASIDAGERMTQFKKFNARRNYNNLFGGSDAETVINFATIEHTEEKKNDKGETATVTVKVLNFTLLFEQLQAMKIGDVTMEDLRLNSGIGVGENAVEGTLPENWKPQQLIEFLQKPNRLKNPAGISLSQLQDRMKLELEKPENKDKSWSDVVKMYAAEFKRLGRHGFDAWWEWIKSLPENVIIREHDVQDQELKKLLAQESALKSVLGVIEDLDSWYAKTSSALDDGFDELLTLQSEIDANTKSVSPARSPSEQAEQSRMLLDTAKSVLADLEVGTGFSIEPNERIRRTAFYLGMREGVGAARDFLRCPEGFALTHPDLVDEVNEYQTRVNGAEVAAGRDILKPMKDKLGVTVAPHALTIIGQTLGADGQPVTVDDLLTNPDNARIILSCIVFDDPASGKSGGANALVTSYRGKCDVPGFLTAAEAGEYVRLVHRHLSHQMDDRNVIDRQLNRTDPGNQFLNAIRTARDTLSEMWKDGDFTEKAAVAALVFGAIYAAYKAWKAGGMWRNLLVGVPAFVGLDIAIKRATGKGVMDRLNLNFMNEKDRDSSLEQFVRLSRSIDDHDLDNAPGREALQQMMNPKNPVPVADLLRWRQAVLVNGRQDFASAAPASLRVNAVVEKIGIASTNVLPMPELKQEGYKTMFKAFEALCIGVADGNGLGGSNPQERAALGAKLLQQRYVDFSEPYLATVGMAGSLQQCCNTRPGRCFSMADVLVFERPTPAMNDALEQASWTEWAAAKLGISFEKFKDLLAQGYTTAQIKIMDAYDKAPDLVRGAKKNVLESFDSFMEWARPTTYKVGQEITEDFMATYNFLTGTTKAFGLAIVRNGPTAIEWTYNKTLDIGGFTKNKAIDVYRELRRHQVSGKILDGFEELFTLLFKESVKDADIEDLSKIDSFKKPLIRMLEKVSLPPAIGTFSKMIDKWLVDIDAAEPIPGSLVGIKERGTSEERMLKYELLKREIFSFLAAARVSDIEQGMRTPNYKHVPQHRQIGWVGDIDKNTMRFSPSEPEHIRFFDTYLHIRSRYNNADILSLIGQERTMDGYLKDYAAQNPGTFAGGSAGFADVLIDWVTRSTSAEYLVHDLAVYTKSLNTEAEQLHKNGELNDEAYRNYKYYLDALLLNVVMESALSEAGPTPADLTLKVDQAQKYLLNLRTLRGDSPKASRVKGHADLLRQFDLPDAVAPQMLEDVLLHEKGKWMLAGQEPPKSTPVATGGVAPGSAPATGPTVNVAPLPTDETVIDDLADSRKTNITKAEAQKAVLKAIPGAGTRQGELRKRFDDDLATNRLAPFDYKLKSTHTELHNYLLGVSDLQIKKVEDIILNGVENSKSLDDLEALRKKSTDPTEIARVQHVLDRAVLKILSKSNSVIDDIAAVDPKKLAAHPDRAKWETELAGLYRASSDKTAHLLPDTVSFVLEYLFTGGNYTSTDITKYNKYITSLGLAAVSEQLPPRTITERWVKGYDAIAAERFTRDRRDKLNGANLKKLVGNRISIIEPLLDK